MSTRAEVAKKIGLDSDAIVQELGWDEDVDESFREAVSELLSSPIEDETYDGIVDATVLWWRASDGDLFDGLLDVLTTLDEDGFVLLCVPKMGSDEHVDAVEVREACEQSGMRVSSPIKFPSEWSMTKLIAGGDAKHR